MSDLFLELMSEEIPASLLEESANNINDIISINLDKNNIIFNNAEFFYSPKRLVFQFRNIKPKEKNIVIRGPSVKAPRKAIEGFAQSNKIKPQKLIIKKTDKGEYYYLYKKITDREIKSLIINILETNLVKIPWKKSMKWGESNLKWIRPLRNILCIFNKKHIKIKLHEFVSSNHTLSSNLLDKNKIKINSGTDYFRKLKNMNVIISQHERKKYIINKGIKIASKLNLEVKFDKEITNEVVNLVEFPVLFLAKFDKKYLKLPSEILVTSMKKNQKYFPLYKKNKELSNFFLVISNINPKDNGKTIIEGNQRVIAARLEDANFFWNKDIQESFNNKKRKLERVIFHNQLGSVENKVKRMMSLAEDLKIILKLDKKDLFTLKKATEICKNDLVTEIVREFPSLQGLMGYYYSKNDNYDEEISKAIKDHYKPYGPLDNCPETKLSSILAIIDKLDTLSGFFSINKEPTSSKDPYALRRAGLGIIRIILKEQFSFDLCLLLEKSLTKYYDTKILKLEKNKEIREQVIEKIKKFILERLENFLKDSYKFNSYIYESLVLKSDSINILKIKYNCDLLNQYIISKGGVDFLVAFKRITNILESEKYSDLYFQKDLLKSEPEKNLFVEYNKVLNLIDSSNSFKFNVFNSLTKPINSFFENVKINDKNNLLKNNRLGLLSLIKNNLIQIVNFSKIIKGKEL